MKVPLNIKKNLLGGLSEGEGVAIIVIMIILIVGAIVLVMVLSPSIKAADLTEETAENADTTPSDSDTSKNYIVSNCDSRIYSPVLDEYSATFVISGITSFPEMNGNYIVCTKKLTYNDYDYYLFTQENGNYIFMVNNDSTGFVVSCDVFDEMVDNDLNTFVPPTNEPDDFGTINPQNVINLNNNIIGKWERTTFGDRNNI